MVWLASWPRSGNTFLRTILWNCFGLKSASVYPKDLGYNKELALQIGHVEREEITKDTFKPGDPFLLKTHEPPKNDKPAIYVLRDGRPACVSLWKFYNKIIPLEAVISGNHRFGAWARHVESWDPQNRPNTLFLKYEDMVRDIRTVIDSIGAFLDKTPSSYELPSRDHIAEISKHHVKKYSDWQDILTGDYLKLFWYTNGAMMEKMYGISEPGVLNPVHA
jgi:hypothetical protein